MVGGGREWLAAQPLPATAREHVTVAVEMIDALDRAAGADRQGAKRHARRQKGCKALLHYGIET